MSAFVVAPKTISSVVDVIAKHEPVPDRNLLAKRLFLLNVESVNQRYRLKDSEREDNRKEYEQYLANAENIQYFEQPERHPAHHVMAARCWLYQSCEGNCDNDPLFVSVGKIVEKETIAVASELSGRLGLDAARAGDIVHRYVEDSNLESPWN